MRSGSTAVFRLMKQPPIPHLQYSVNKEGFDHLTSTRLGRTLLITNRLEWSAYEVITCYRELKKIEEVFKHLKNRQYLHWQPAFH